MMKVRFLAPVLLPVRLRIDLALSRRLPGSADQPPQDGAVLITEGRSTGAARISSSWCSVPRTVQVGGADVVVQVDADLRSVVLVSLEREFTNSNQVEQFERELTEAVNRALPGWSSELVAGLAAGSIETAPTQALPPNRVLWWHRVYDDAQHGQVPSTTVDFGVPARFGDTGVALVGNGSTVTTRITDLAPVLEGLASATVDWIVLDELNRELSAVLIGLSAAHPDEALYEQCLALERRISLYLLMRDESSRYLANGAAAVVDAAATSWRTQDEVRALARRAQSIRDLTLAWRSWAAAQRDERRNRIILVLTIIVGLQGLLAVFDFITNDRVTISSGLRLALGSGFAFTALVMVLVSALPRGRSNAP